MLPLPEIVEEVAAPRWSSLGAADDGQVVPRAQGPLPPVAGPNSRTMSVTSEWLKPLLAQEDTDDEGDDDWDSGSDGSPRADEPPS